MINKLILPGVVITAAVCFVIFFNTSPPNSSTFSFSLFLSLDENFFPMIPNFIPSNGLFGSDKVVLEAMHKLVKFDKIMPRCNVVNCIYHTTLVYYERLEHYHIKFQHEQGDSYIFNPLLGKKSYMIT